MKAWLKSLALAAIAVFAPIKAVMATVVVLIAMDLVLGVMAAIKRKEPITSAALRRTVSKVVVYEMAVCAAFLCEKFMISEALPLVKLAAAAIAATELKSILENVNAVNGTPVFAALIQTLGSKNEPPKAD